jgi:hypothetical protein
MPKATESARRRLTMAQLGSGKNLGFSPHQTRESDVQHSSVSVITHRKRHLEVVLGMNTVRELEVPFPHRPGFA